MTTSLLLVRVTCRKKRKEIQFISNQIDTENTFIGMEKIELVKEFANQSSLTVNSSSS